jgi:hypothetical protein
MTKDEYPLPKAAKKGLRILNTGGIPYGEFGNNVDEFEERIFRNASHFNVVRFGTHNGSESTTTDNFLKALELVKNEPRALIYAATTEGRAFCVPKKQYEKYRKLWETIHG